MVSERTSERVAGTAGLVFVVGAIVGFGVLVGSVPGPGAEAGEIRDFLGRSELRVWAGGYLGLLAELGFLVFAGALWGLLRAAEGAPGWISTTGLTAAAALVAAILAGDLVPGAVAFRAGEDADLATVGLLLDAKKLTEILTVPLLAVFLGAAALVSLRAAALPRWAGWGAAVVAVLALVAAPLGYEPSQLPSFLTLLWIAAVSVRLLARPLPR